MKINNLTIGIPIFNGRKSIPKVLDSIVNYKDVEIIISDNCSTDGTIEILNEFSSKHKNIKVNFNKSNIGFDSNLMKCIELCKTDFMWLLSDDDIVKNNGINIVNNIIQKNKSYGLIYVDNLYEFSGIDQSKSGSDPNDFFRFTKFRSGGMSSNIINVKIWKSINFDIYNKDWPHLVYAIIALTKNNFYIHSDSLKYELDPNIEKRWLESSSLFNYLYSLKDTFDIMKTYKIYTSQTIRNSRKILSKHISTAIIVNKKHKINFNYKSLLFIFKYSRNFIFKNILLLIVPRKFMNIIKKLINLI